MNRRPLDPQKGGVGVFAVQRRSGCRARRVVTCGLFGRLYSVWSPSGPQRGHEKPGVAQPGSSASMIFCSNASRSCAMMTCSAVGLGCSVAVHTGPSRSICQRWPYLAKICSSREGSRSQCRCWIRISGRPRLLPRSGRPRNSVEDMAYVEHPVPPGVLNPPHNPDPPR